MADPVGDGDFVTVLGLGPQRASLVPFCASVGVFKQLCRIPPFGTGDPFCDCFDGNKKSHRSDCLGAGDCQAKGHTVAAL